MWGKEMKIAGYTFDIAMGRTPVYECEKCGLRTKFKHDSCPECRKKIRQHHIDEGQAGIL